mmetsp:Transcript_48514/g.150124  ORF Transcript_48514/g.150124 Transcript_48514/m.150124 type:complete len:485 (-) Transcript_48514:610-2064(-)
MARARTSLGRKSRHRAERRALLGPAAARSSASETAAIERSSPLSAASPRLDSAARLTPRSPCSRRRSTAATTAASPLPLACNRAASAACRRRASGCSNHLLIAATAASSPFSLMHPSTRNPTSARSVQGALASGVVPERLRGSSAASRQRPTAAMATASPRSATCSRTESARHRTSGSGESKRRSTPADRARVPQRRVPVSSWRAASAPICTAGSVCSDNSPVLDPPSTARAQAAAHLTPTAGSSSIARAAAAAAVSAPAGLPGMAKAASTDTRIPGSGSSRRDSWTSWSVPCLRGANSASAEKAERLTKASLCSNSGATAATASPSRLSATRLITCTATRRTPALSCFKRPATAATAASATPMSPLSEIAAMTSEAASLIDSSRCSSSAPTASTAAAPASRPTSASTEALRTPVSLSSRHLQRVGRRSASPLREICGRATTAARLTHQLGCSSLARTASRARRWPGPASLASVSAAVRLISMS